MQGRAFEIFPKFKKIQHSKAAQIRFQNFPNVFSTCFGSIFPIFITQCSMQGFSDYPDLKIRVQFYDTILNRHSFCIHATVSIGNPISDFLDLKLWVQIRELKNKSLIFWTWKVWIQFSGLKIWGRYLEKTQEKN